MAESWSHEYAKVNGIRLHYLSQGKGYPLVLLHGWPETSYSWRKVISPLAEKFHVIAPDLRGFGDSDKPEGLHTKRTVAKDIRELLRHLGYDRVAIVGHDWGGCVAHFLAMDYTDLSERLIIINMPYYHPTIPLPEDLQQKTNMWYNYFHLVPDLPEKIIANNLEDYLRNFLNGWSYNKNLFTDEEVAEYVRAYSKPGAIAGGVNYYRVFYKQDVEDYSTLGDRKFEMPVLVLWGENDPTAPLIHSDGLHRFMPQLTLKFIPQCGHFLQSEKPDLLVRELLEFLKDKL